MTKPSIGRADEAGRGTRRGWTILMWRPLPLSLLITLADGQTALLRAGLAALLATGGTIVAAWRRDDLMARLAIALTLVSAASVLVSCLWETTWASGGDLAYVTVLALLAAFRDWRVLAVAGPAIVLQRIGLAMWISPSHPALATLAASLPPAATLVIESAALIWLTHALDTTVAALRRDIAATNDAASKRERSLRLMSETASDLAGQATADRLARQFEQDVGVLVGAAARAADGVRGAVMQISDVAEDTARQAAAITGASAEVSASARSVAVSVEQFSSSVNATASRRR